MKLTSSKNSAIILLTLLVAVLLFAVYYYIVLPKKDEAQSLETSVGTIKTEVSTLQSEIAQIEEDRSKKTTNVYALRQKLPKDRNIDDLILNIEEIEYVTGSRILSINFNNYDQEVSNSNIAKNQKEGDSQNNTKSEEGNNSNTEGNNSNTEGNNTNTEGNNTNTEGNNSNTENNKSNESNGNSENTQQPVSTIANLQLPSSLKLLTFSIEVESPKYEKLLDFIREIEKLERVMHVDTISFDLPGELQEFEENPSKYVKATIQVTTFYYTGNR